MVYVSSPLISGFLFRMVYLVDRRSYDLVPEYDFPIRFMEDGKVVWPRGQTEGHGSAVQTLRFDTVDYPPGADGGHMAADEYGKLGVRIVRVMKNGEMCWWTVTRREDESVGVEDMVL
jgi:hypothetical protein